MVFNMTKCLECLSLALDFVVVNYLNVSLNHSRRVTYIALNVGHALELSEDEIKDLFALSLLHDNGMTLAGLLTGENELNPEQIIKIDKSIAQSRLRFKKCELMPEHCIEGEKNIQCLPMLSANRNVIKYHHENHDGSGIFGIEGYDIPLFSRIIHMADSLDVNYNLSSIKPHDRKKIFRFLKKHNKKMFAPETVEAFFTFSNKERFWSDLSFFNINEVLSRVAPQIIYEYSWDKIIPISETFMKIIDCKSGFTFNHSRGITEIMDMMTEFYGFDDDKRKKLHIAANLHDLGKLYIPNYILEKPAKLDSYEFDEIRKHSYFTKLALDKIPGFEDISNWAANHHEKLNGKGYPESLSADDIDFESRLMTVVDIYQAITEERPYRKGSTHPEAMKILYKLAEEGMIDKKIVKDIDEVAGSKSSAFI